jgi:hypothetical protein
MRRIKKEVAVGTLIQDPQQRNPESRPRWDRFERADAFEQYRELRTQGISERQAAKELEVPRTTLQAWRRMLQPTFRLTSRLSCPNQLGAPRKPNDANSP